jgi:hypothetical protein
MVRRRGQAGGLAGDYVDVPPTFTNTEFDGSVCLRKQRIVTPTADIAAGMNPGAALAQHD